MESLRYRAPAETPLSIRCSSIRSSETIIWAPVVSASTPEIQHKLLPIIGVLTAGSPGVAPYSETDARFEVEASQFEVADQRPFEVILGECLARGAIIDGYEPPDAKAMSPAAQPM